MTPVQPHRRSFHREDRDSRKSALIRATLSLIADNGPAAATVRAIADEAGITQGMIRHYFSSKEELVNAAYQAHMMRQLEAVDHFAGPGPARDQLRRFIVASLTPPVSEPRAVSLWAAFLHMVRRDPAMLATHEETYLAYRDRLQSLIAAALAEAGRTAGPAELRRLAIACNAVIDGLWLEAGILPTAFAEGEIAAIGLRSVADLLTLRLTEEHP